MRAILTLLVIALAAGLLLVVLGVFEDAPAPTPGDTPTDGTKDDPTKTELETAPPAKEPPLIMETLEAPLNVLLLSQRPTTWSVFLGKAIVDTREAKFATWYTISHDARDPQAGAGPGPSQGLTLTDKPKASDFERLDIEVLVLDAVDPNGFPSAFWDEVKTRVAAGKLGLWARPGFPVGAEGAAVTAHPMLSHPVVSKLLPVAKAAPLAGNPVPGTFPPGKGGALRITETGVKHPASRMSRYPKWSRHFWQGRSTGEYGWRPEFVYPVTELASGALSLVEIEESPIKRSPAIVISSSETGRVLWQGNFDFGHRTYFSAEGTAPIGVWVNRALVWLSGRAN